MQNRLMDLRRDMVFPAASTARSPLFPPDVDRTLKLRIRLLEDFSADDKTSHRSQYSDD
jgi:hypothetical protein